ncbi:MAG: T9SS type A sorting domain-containing protein [Bacteroidetes bacterium]|nr:T9SS type A sorting domain-containing protein [Bacteroidota bacterium]
MRKSVLILIVLIFAKEVFSDNYITRGQQPQELYIASHWFIYADTSTIAIFFTDDYGESIIMKYYSGWSLNGTYGMPIGRIGSDKTNGVIYNVVMTSLWRSDDFGCTWDSIRALNQTPYHFISSGCQPGEIYCKLRGNTGDSIGLYRSQDYGQNFIFQSDTIYGNIEVGNEPGSVYTYMFNSYEQKIYIGYSTNYGLSFDTVAYIDSDTVGFGYVASFPNLSRGSVDGEVYLITLFDNFKFKIFHSMDWGQTFELRYESTTFDPVIEHFSFSAGNEPGSFYFSKMIPLYHQEANTLLCIYHSSDTAKTFTEHCYILDTGFPVNIYEEQFIKRKQIDINNYPNPFINYTIISMDLEEPGIYTIELYNLTGQAVLRKEEYFDSGSQKTLLNEEQLVPGVYLLSLKSKGRLLGVRKIVKGR